MRTVKKMCEGCGVVFDVTFYERNRQRFCGPSCVYANVTTKKIDKNISDSILYHYKAELKSLSDVALLVGMKYHNVRRVLIQNKVRIRSNSEQQKINFKHDPNRHVGDSVDMSCPICGEEFNRWKSACVRYEDKKNFCSRECCYIDRTFRDCILRYGKGWYAAKKQARSRDRVCGICKKTACQNGRLLDVHHIYPMRFFLEDKVGAHKLSNLACLCRSCHKKVDARGRKYERTLQGSKQQSSINKIWKRAFKEIRDHTPVFCG